MQLTSSGEVAVFVDDNQFASGQSQDKCGPEAVAVFWHSVKPGEKNPYTSADIHEMASADYVRFIGPDVTSDHAGTDNATLYKLLAAHNFMYKIGPLDMAWVKEWLNAGYPVILGGVAESSVFDLGLNANPYNWNTAGLFHIILATGPGATGEVLVRDTANIDHSGIVRPGPRRYRLSGLTFTTATMVIPSWMPVPTGDTPPVPQPPAPPAPLAPPAPPAPPAPDYKKMALDALTQLQQALQHLS